MEIEWKDEILYQDLVKWDSRLKQEAPFFNELIKSINKPKSRILDVSCGTGDHLVMFAKWGFDGVGIDISEQNIAEARKIASINKVVDKVDFIVGDMLKLEETLKEEKFDFIYCIGNTFSIFTPEERAKIINEMINLLNKEGKVVIQVVNYLSHTNDSEWFYNPNISRGKNEEIQYHVRIMEWIVSKEKIRMYVLKTQQVARECDDFTLHNKTTEFFVIQQKEYEKLAEKNNLNLNIYGDYQKNSFEENGSNDLVVILEKCD
ncbi:MAG: class I SAM-dependent methyltransferase [Candidatus Heimdallarchaeota archaeon]|nr:class I SAM-dependent methyltransferase [Candidatus Heimdallarchaeota archaeon]